MASCLEEAKVELCQAQKPRDPQALASFGLVPLPAPNFCLLNLSLLSVFFLFVVFILLPKGMMMQCHVRF